MGTNYFVEVPRTEPCDECGCEGGTKTWHIGKSSAGWKFIFNPRLPSFKLWKQFLSAYVSNISDEYDQPIGFEDFCDMVEVKQSGVWGADRPDQYQLTPYYQSEHLDEDGYRISKHKEFS